MSLATHLECSRCGREEALAQRIDVCPACGDPLFVRYDLVAARHVASRYDLTGRPRSLWRFAELLPGVPHREQVTLGEGGTPLLRAPRLEAAIGHAPLFVKDEGHNPTFSFKARGMAMAVSCARAHGATRVAAPSAGNAGGALAAYAARAGLPALVVFPSDTPPAFPEDARRHGAEVELVPGLIGDAARRVAERAGEGWSDLSTFREPYRVEGKKTLGFEIVEDLGFRYPDWIVFPTGGGVGLVGIWKALAELEAIGWVRGRRPRMVAAQASGCAPIVDAMERGLSAVEPPARPSTRAVGLRIPKPLAARLILAALRESDGAAVRVSEDDIARAVAELASREGIDASPEGGVAWAAVRQLVADGRIGRDETVVIVCTGAGVRYRGIES
jgi:threonine synthase